jgi:hypothetical protein
MACEGTEAHENTCAEYPAHVMKSQRHRQDSDTDEDGDAVEQLRCQLDRADL